VNKLILASLVGLCVLLNGCSNKQKEFDTCVEKGIQYYKDIDSYPMLKTENISAESKAKQLCSNSLIAFN